MHFDHFDELNSIEFYFTLNFLNYKIKFMNTNPTTIYITVFTSFFFFCLIFSLIINIFGLIILGVQPIAYISTYTHINLLFQNSNHI